MQVQINIFKALMGFIRNKVKKILLNTKKVENLTMSALSLTSLETMALSERHDKNNVITIMRQLLTGFDEILSTAKKDIKGKQFNLKKRKKKPILSER